MDWLLRVWRGEVPLPVTFFGPHLGGWALLWMLNNFAPAILDRAQVQLYGMLMLLVMPMFFVWSMTGVWRSAKKASKWPRLIAQFWVIALILSFVYDLILVPMSLS